MIKLKWKDNKPPKFTATYKKSVLTATEKRELTKELADDWLKRSAEAISRGKGTNGKPIKAGGYSEAYRKAIRRGWVKGYNGVKKTKISPVDLKITGDFIKSRATKFVKGGVSIFFKGSHKMKKGTIRNAKLFEYLRLKGFVNFHEFGKKDYKKFNEELYKAIKKKLHNKSIFRK